MAQPRISAMERPGETALNVETLVRLASAFKVGLKIEFVEFSEMLAWENNYSQDEFDVLPLDEDRAFLNPTAVTGARLLPVSNLLSLNRGPLGSLNELFMRGVRTGYDRYSQIAGSGRILTGLVQSHTVTAQIEPFIATASAVENRYQDVPISLVAARALSYDTLRLTGAENG